MTKHKCRICLDEKINVTNLFESDNNSSQIADKIMFLTKIKVDHEDGYPSKICQSCLNQLNNCVKFVQLCHDSDFKLRALSVQKEEKTELDIENDLHHSDYTEDFKKTSPNNCLLINAFDDNTNLCYDDDCLDNKVMKSNIALCNQKSKDKQQCFTCGKVMSSRFRLKTHLRTHTGERPFTCPHCSKSFSWAENLKVHIRTHTGEKPLTCPDCGESFAHTAGLAAHRRKHSGQMPYSCTLCPRSFRTIGHLQYHTRKHTGEKNFECETCGRAFITRSDLKKHQLSHTGDKPHICCVCGLRLTRASHLKRHIQHIHKGEKPYACDSQKADVKKHKKKHETKAENKT